MTILGKTSAAPTTTAPARELVRARMDPTIQRLIPDTLLDARIGKGTVASEYDRAIRYRVEHGDSGLVFIPETSAAATLAASSSGPKFEQLLRSSAMQPLWDSTNGVDNLHAITFVPDEQSAKAVSLMADAVGTARSAGTRMGTTASSAGNLARMYGKEIPAELAFAAAWNADGDILVAPDQARNLLALADAYKFGNGDSFLHAGRDTTAKHQIPTPDRPASTAKRRDFILRDTVNTLVHERQHSVSPMGNRGSETSSIFEEVAASVLAQREQGLAAKGSGLDVAGTARNPASAVDHSGLNWQPWNRDKLPQPPADEVATSKGRYEDGPKVVHELFHVAGIDQRTTAGHAEMTRILQDGDIARAPRRLADAIIAHLDVPASHREELVELVKRSVQNEQGSRLVTAQLQAWGINA